MVGRLNLPNVTDGDPPGMSSSGAERGLDSPDSGLPPSPSPSAWLPAACAEKARGVSPVCEDGARASQVAGTFAQLQPLSFGEGIKVDILPPKELRYTSFLRVDSDRHFIQDVSLRLWGQSLEHCRHSVVLLPQSTWRHYKTQLDFQPRHRPHRFRSTTIIYPKKASALYVTELSYDSHRLSRRFLSSVELEVSGSRRPPQ